jgi:cytoskeletal protein CcmA (bactofilin family)
VDGTLYGTKSVDLKKSAVLVGDIYTSRIAIEEGASLKGSVLVQKDIPCSQTKKEGEAAIATKLI